MALALHEELSRIAMTEDDIMNDTTPRCRQRSRVVKHGNYTIVWRALVLVALFLVPYARAQVIGEDICACSPSVFTFQLDFSQTCPPVNIPKGDGTGINQTSCVIQAFGNTSTTDLTPVLVTRIDVLELGEMLAILDQEAFDMDFSNGDTFSYTSLAATASNVTDVSDLPRGLQLIVTGQNVEGNTIILFWLMTYTNDCDDEPIIAAGDGAGWTVVSSVTPPRAELCPAASEMPTIAPAGPGSPPPTSVAPSTPPPTTPAPTTAAPALTFVPTESPVQTFVPTESPVMTADPAAPPTPAPTDGPVTPPPTDGPVTPPPTNGPGTPPPTDGPPGTPAPTPAGGTPPPTADPAPTPPDMSMSFDFSFSMSMSMSFDASRMLEEVVDNWDMEFGRNIPASPGLRRKPQLEEKKGIKYSRLRL